MSVSITMTLLFLSVFYIAAYIVISFVLMSLQATSIGTVIFTLLTGGFVVYVPFFIFR